MRNFILLILLILTISCNTEEVYIDVYDPVQEELDSLNQRRTDLSQFFLLETEGINYVDSTNSVFIILLLTMEMSKFILKLMTLLAYI